jgi:hypothetical protein
MYAPNLLKILSFSSLRLTAPFATGSEEWRISVLETHFMTKETGLPIDWPEEKKFNSTIDFTVNLPSGLVYCYANWPYTQIPTTAIPCSREGVWFQLSPPRYWSFTESSFTLTVRETRLEETGLEG